ncbi:HicB family protein [Mycobacteroides abscessus subsp. abscessus]|uniref:hypothetical protein n=1 Tax=Mycobacteroides abscessus TaxID=36809 RepID=UPI00092BC8CF|nr:hypothetical protein [Mycobacteroides abscessus]SHU92866.1 HicB family protein [Mycobacteroides abscessus subsp. abscessus]
MTNEYTYWAEFSYDLDGYVGHCAEFPQLSWVAPTAAGAVAGVVKLVDDVLVDMSRGGEEAPIAGRVHLVRVQALDEGYAQLVEELKAADAARRSARQPDEPESSMSADWSVYASGTRVAVHVPPSPSGVQELSPEQARVLSRLLRLSAAEAAAHRSRRGDEK